MEAETETGKRVDRKKRVMVDRTRKRVVVVVEHRKRVVAVLEKRVLLVQRNRKKLRGEKIIF